MRNLVSTGHVCRRLQLSPAAVRRLTDSGRLFALLLNRQRFYDRDVVEQFAKDREALKKAQENR
jgi:hypothetical protein